MMSNVRLTDRMHAFSPFPAQDGAFEAFTVVAQRQIKYLEEMVKELQQK